jgi:hypothetical protein
MPIAKGFNVKENFGPNAGKGRTGTSNPDNFQSRKERV